MPMIQMNYLTRILFDHGAISRLGSELTRLKMKRPLFVSGPTISKGPLLDTVRAALPGEMPLTLFSAVPANPTEDAVLAALELFRSAGCDSVVCIGGGSPMDLGKAVAMLAANEGPLAQFAALDGGRNKIKAMTPMVMVPTTAGTGSETSVAFVIICRDGRKLTFVSDLLLPKLAICDPNLTLGMPPGLTAATGMDAVTHCIEALLAPAVNPPAEAIAMDGLQRAVGQGWLERAYQDGSDKEARWHMLMATTEAAMAFVKGLGAVHAMSHACGRLHELNLHHGTLNAVILPEVLRINADSVGNKYERLRRAMSLAPHADLATAVEDLNKRLGLPANLRAMGLTLDYLDELVSHSLSDLNHLTNPRKLTAGDYEGMFRRLLA
jgi:4-hydroxybutyrate dehydrogenase